MLQKSRYELCHKLLPSLLVTLLMPLLAHTAIAEEAFSQTNSVVLAVEDSWPPFAGAEGQGIATNIVEKALAEVDIRLILEVSPYARVLDDVKKGIVVGGYNVTRQVTTEKQFLFGQQALLTASASFYFPAKNTQIQKYTNIADIPDGTRLGLIINYEYGDLFDQHKHRFKQVRVSKQTQIINMLKNGRLDSAIMFDAVATHTIMTMKLEPASILKGPLNHTSNIYVAFSLQHKDAQYFSDKLDQGLALIKADGQYEKLLEQ
ncbi:hypothetical protein A9R00_07645 [Oleispira antarctica]|uniref:Uncharacterized protein n=1 Tax=Oleispira antarctica TaxID=188908 RepID=A0A1Y5HSU4_OLEAN|nr:hypothetical protein A9R00_07645 [Oleispira antarctica]